MTSARWVGVVGERAGLGRRRKAPRPAAPEAQPGGQQATRRRAAAGRPARAAASRPAPRRASTACTSSPGSSGSSPPAPAARRPIGPVAVEHRDRVRAGLAQGLRPEGSPAGSAHSRAAAGRRAARDARSPAAPTRTRSTRSGSASRARPPPGRPRPPVPTARPAPPSTGRGSRRRRRRRRSSRVAGACRAAGRGRPPAPQAWRRPRPEEALRSLDATLRASRRQRPVPPVLRSGARRHGRRPRLAQDDDELDPLSRRRLDVEGFLEALPAVEDQGEELRLGPDVHVDRVGVPLELPRPLVRPTPRTRRPRCRRGPRRRSPAASTRRSARTASARRPARGRRPCGRAASAAGGCRRCSACRGPRRRGRRPASICRGGSRSCGSGPRSARGSGWRR